MAKVLPGLGGGIAKALPGLGGDMARRAGGAVGISLGVAIRRGVHPQENPTAGHRWIEQRDFWRVGRDIGLDGMVGHDEQDQNDPHGIHIVDPVRLARGGHRQSIITQGLHLGLRSRKFES